MKLTQLIETKERLYVCVHAKTPKHEVYAKSSYDAAKQAAEYWGMKSTAGIDAHLVEGNYPEPRKMQVTQADKDNNTEAWKRFRAGDPRYEWKDMILSKKEGDVSEAVGEFAQPIYDLIDDLGGDNDAHEIVLNDMVRYLGGDTIQDFVKDFRSNHDMNHPGEDGDYGDDDKNFESVKEATHGEAKPIYDLVGSLGAGDIELAQNPVFQDLVRFLDADTINKFVTDFRNKMAKDKDFKGSVDFGQYKESFNDEEYNDEERAGMEYTVWVGGTEVNDKWLNYEEAKELYDLWRAKGYDDVQLDARLKEGSFWGRDDMVAKMKKDYKASGMRKYRKDTGTAHYGTTTSDPEEWERLEADGYEWDKDYYNDIEELEAKWKAKNEGAKPDFLDLDKDGDKKEPMKKAAKDKKAVKEDDGLIKRQDGKYDQADIAHGKDDGKLRLDPATGKYDPDEIRAMQYQQNVADPLNREIDASQKAITIEVDYDLELDKPKSKNPLLKKHYKEMRKFNVFISMPEWQEGPKDSGFGIWTAKVRGSKKNLLGWLKAWEFDYDKEELADMGLGESRTDEWAFVAPLAGIAARAAVGGLARGGLAKAAMRGAMGGMVGKAAVGAAKKVASIGSDNATKSVRYGTTSTLPASSSIEKFNDLNASKKPKKNAKKLNAVKEKEEKTDDLLKGFDPKTARALMMLKTKYPQADNVLSALLADVENNEKDSDVADLTQGHNIEKLKKAVDILQKEINLLKGDKKRKNEAYNPETGRDPNKPTPEWDNLIAKAKKKQGISDEEEVWFNYEDIGGNIIVNPKSTVEDQIGELLNRYYDISPMEFDPSKIEITTPDQTNQDANFAKVQNEERTDEIIPLAVAGLAGALMADRKAKRDAKQLNAEEGDAEAIAARDEFLKVMDMKPKGGLKDIPKAIDTIKKIVADKQNQQVKFDDGKMKVDLYTASAVSQVYDAVKPETQGKIDDMLRTKEGMLKMSNFAFSKLSEGIKAGKRIDEILPALAIAARALAPAVGQVAKKVAGAAVKHPIKTASVVNTLKDKDKTVTQKATNVARITSSKYDLDELQAPYTGADAVIDKNGKGHKPGSPKANMIINMKKKAPVAKPLQNKKANTSGVKPAQSTVKPVGVGRGNAPGSKATQIQPGGGSKAGMAGMASKATPSQITQAKKDVMKNKVKAVGKKVYNMGKSAIAKSMDRTGMGNPLSASKYSPEDKAVDMMKNAMKAVK